MLQKIAKKLTLSITRHLDIDKRRAGARRVKVSCNLLEQTDQTTVKTGGIAAKPLAISARYAFTISLDCLQFRYSSNFLYAKKRLM
jgi:hypothetical protein